MTVYHIEMKKNGYTYQFVSKDISEKAMFKWVYETMNDNFSASMTIYYPTQLSGGKFMLYNEFGKVRDNNGIKFYGGRGSTYFIKPNGELSISNPNKRRV